MEYGMVWAVKNKTGNHTGEEIGVSYSMVESTLGTACH
jgi:hypothetical protein